MKSTRRVFSFGIAPAAHMALAELRQAAAQDTGGDPIPLPPPGPGQFCGACNADGSCDAGFVCTDGICGNPAIRCAGKYWACGSKSRFECKTDKHGVETAICHYQHKKKGKTRHRVPDAFCP